MSKEKSRKTVVRLLLALLVLLTMCFLGVVVVCTVAQSFIYLAPVFLVVMVVGAISIPVAISVVMLKSVNVEDRLGLFVVTRKDAACAVCSGIAVLCIVCAWLWSAMCSEDAKYLNTCIDDIAGDLGVDSSYIELCPISCKVQYLVALGTIDTASNVMANYKDKDILDNLKTLHYPEYMGNNEYIRKSVVTLDDLKDKLIEYVLVSSNESKEDLSGSIIEFKAVFQKLVSDMSRIILLWEVVGCVFVVMFVKVASTVIRAVCCKVMLRSMKKRGIV